MKMYIMREPGVMRTLSVKQVRQRLSEVIRAAEAGESIVITRYGTPIAQITGAPKQRPSFPDLSGFRTSIKQRGKSLTTTLRDMRGEERY